MGVKKGLGQVPVHAMASLHQSYSVKVKGGDKDTSVIETFTQYWVKIKRILCALALKHVFVSAFPGT